MTCAPFCPAHFKDYLKINFYNLHKFLIEWDPDLFLLNSIPLKFKHFFFLVEGSYKFFATIFHLRKILQRFKLKLLRFIKNIFLTFYFKALNLVRTVISQLKLFHHCPLVHFSSSYSLKTYSHVM